MVKLYLKTIFEIKPRNETHNHRISGKIKILSSSLSAQKTTWCVWSEEGFTF